MSGRSGDPARRAAVHGSDYYDPVPRRVLGRPLALASAPGLAHRWIARTLAALEGLPYTDLDRRLEHTLGQGLWPAMEALGPAAIWRVERRLLAEAVAERPAALIALGDGVLLHHEELDELLAGSCFVVLETDPSDAYWRLVRQRRPSWNPYLPEPLGGVEDLRRFLAERREGARCAHLRIDARGARPQALVEQLRGTLSELSR